MSRLLLIVLPTEETRNIERAAGIVIVPVVAIIGRTRRAAARKIGHPLEQGAARSAAAPRTASGTRAAPAALFGPGLGVRSTGRLGLEGIARIGRHLVVSELKLVLRRVAPAIGTAIAPSL